MEDVSKIIALPLRDYRCTVILNASALETGISTGVRATTPK